MSFLTTTEFVVASIVWVFSVRSLFFGVVIGVLSSFVLILLRKRMLVVLLCVVAVCVLCLCSVSVPHGSFGWYEVCDLGSLLVFWFIKYIFYIKFVIWFEGCCNFIHFHE